MNSAVRPALRFAAPAICALACLAASCGPEAERDSANAAMATPIFEPAVPAAWERVSYFPGRVATGALAFSPVGLLGAAVTASSSAEPAWTAGGASFRPDADGRLAAEPLAPPSGEPVALDLLAVGGGLSFACLPGGLLEIRRGSLTAISIPGAFGGSGPVRLGHSGEVVVVSGSDGRVAAYGADGSPRWSAAGRAGPLTAAGGLVAWAREDGSLDVRMAPDGSSPALAPVQGFSRSVAPVMDGRRIYALMEDGTVVALDARTLAVAWRSAPGVRVEYLAADDERVFAFGADSMAAMLAADGAIDSGASAALPCRPVASPVAALVGGRASWWYAGTDGVVYRSGNAAAGSVATPVQAAISATLEKYLQERPFPGTVAVFRPYVRGAPHEDGAAFTVFSFRPAVSAELAVRLKLAEGDEAIVAIFDQAGVETVSNADEFGAHASFRHWFESGSVYHVAVGRKAPEDGDPAVTLFIE